MLVRFLLTTPHPALCAAPSVSSLSVFGFVLVHPCPILFIPRLFPFNTCYSWATLGASNPTSSEVNNNLARASPSKARLVLLQRPLEPIPGANCTGTVLVLVEHRAIIHSGILGTNSRDRLTQYASSEPLYQHTSCFCELCELFLTLAVCHVGNLIRCLGTNSWALLSSVSASKPRVIIAFAQQETLKRTPWRQRLEGLRQHQQISRLNGVHKSMETVNIGHRFRSPTPHMPRQSNKQLMKPW